MNRISELKLNTPIGKILHSLFFWTYVAFAYPLIGIFANVLGITNILEPRLLFEIATYFDIKLFAGILVGCVLYLMATKLILFVKLSYSPNAKSNLFNESMEEIASQLIGIGSIINVGIIMVFVFTILLPVHGAENFHFKTNLWLGLIFWIIGYGCCVIAEKSKKNF